MQFDFVKQCLHLLRDGGVHICLDTSGWGGHAAELAPLVDLFLWDIKHTDAEKHRALTGVELAPIRQSLRKTDERGVKIRIRCPIIPEVNATEEHLRAVGKIAQPLKHLEGIDLVPYHPLGLSKSAALGRRCAGIPAFDGGRKSLPPERFTGRCPSARSVVIKKQRALPAEAQICREGLLRYKGQRKVVIFSSSTRPESTRMRRTERSETRRGTLGRVTETFSPESPHSPSSVSSCSMHR